MPEVNKEQLELAARACRYRALPDQPDLCLYVQHEGLTFVWAPHRDQADSERMGCDLEIETMFYVGYVYCQYGEFQARVDHDNTIEGRRAAVREARLLVAVEIGRAMAWLHK